MLKVLRITVVVCLAYSAFGATSVKDLVSRHGSLKTAPGQQVSNFTVTVGHATFTLANGTVVPVLAGDAPAGLFLSGTGTFTYTTVNKDELAAVRYNTKNSGVTAQAGADKVSIAEPFKSVLVLGNGLPSITPSGADAAAAWTENRALFARNTFGTPASHLFAYAAIDAPAARVVRAEVQGAERPYIYEYDGAYDGEESLQFLRKLVFQRGGSKLDDVLWESTLSQQVVGRPARSIAPARVKLVDVDVNLTGRMDETGTLIVVETIVPQQRPAEVLRFALNHLLLYDSERPARRFNLKKVTDGKGRALEFVHASDDLLVSLAEPAPAGQPLKLTFEIDGDFLYRPEKSHYWELGITPWFPWVRMHEQAFTFHSVVKVEKPYVSFASGKSLRRVEEGGFNVNETKLEQPVGWVAILAGKYHFDEETRNGVTVRVASFLVKNNQAYKELRNLAFNAIEHYPTFLGPFPFNEITVIEKNDFGYGQAPAGIVFITKEAFTPKLGEANDYVQGVNLRFLHELAHQYWGSAVSMRSMEEQWLDEAFAEYSASLFFRGTNLDGQYQRAFTHWKANAKDATEVAAIPAANRLVNSRDGLHAYVSRTNLIYAKGALLLAAIHRELGDQMFLTFLKSYQKSFRWKNMATTKDAIDLLTFLTKKDWAPWFEQYYYGTAVPEVKGK
ncbi:MAG TPA: M1 family aminopeptidase [Thermoanaerobaculia bacterium]|nr:M1 family aminopeptidase [Thermoanaerobaculia bacterium]